MSEKDREGLIIKKYGLVRFHHGINLETLFNGILQAQPGKMIQLYDLPQLGPRRCRLGLIVRLVPFSDCLKQN